MPTFEEIVGKLRQATIPTLGLAGTANAVRSATDAIELFYGLPADYT